jgi:hypothetical protein
MTERQQGRRWVKMEVNQAYDPINVAMDLLGAAKQNRDRLRITIEKNIRRSSHGQAGTDPPVCPAGLRHQQYVRRSRIDERITE